MRGEWTFLDIAGSPKVECKTIADSRLRDECEYDEVTLRTTRVDGGWRRNVCIIGVVLLVLATGITIAVVVGGAR